MLIEVFKTNVASELQAREIKDLLLRHFPFSRINFDLDDCDRILRMEGADFITKDVILLVNNKGVACTVLE